MGRYAISVMLVCCEKIVVYSANYLIYNVIVIKETSLAIPMFHDMATMGMCVCVRMCVAA